ncbi:MAG: glucan biosynthesis protein [Alphaproteobacteria bacterium]
MLPPSRPARQRVTRRHILGSLAVAGGAAILPGRIVRAADEPPTTFETVRALARARAREPYKAPNRDLPRTIARLTYDQHRDIRFRRDRALQPGDGTFRVELFHQGFLFNEAVAVNIARPDGIRTVEYDPAMFDFGANAFAQTDLEGLGFAGLRLHYPLHRPDYWDELAVFLGASYFRVLGRNQQYGLSARALAIDTAAPTGEEFPSFRAFWIVEPPLGADRITLFALLDGPSLAGAYRFEIVPGTATTVDVEAMLVPRRTIGKLGLAPLTSMFLNGENQRRIADDFRPEVHDSDGLWMHRGNGEWLWRPLTNPRQLRVSAYLDANPRGFGLMQRDRSFASFQDPEAVYERRPSYWIEPQGDWGEGWVELVEIPTDEEVHDNIVAYWVSRTPAGAGDEIAIGWRLSATGSGAALQRAGRVEATRVGRSGVHGTPAGTGGGGRRYVIDFNGDELAELPATLPVEAVVTASAGTISNVTTMKLSATGGWRVFFDFETDAPTADLRCFLRLAGHGLTETWTYPWAR